MASVELRGVSFNYEYDTADDRPVLVLSNSLGTNLDMWFEQIDAFSEHFSVLRYDVRGQGKSSTPAGPYDIATMCGDVLALLDALKIKRAHFCGISMGGMVGQWLGIHAPERLNRLVLSNTAAKIGTTENWNLRIATVQREGMQAIIPAVLKGWFTEAFHRDSPAAIERMEAILRSNDPAGYVACCAAVRDMDQRDNIAQITLPALVIYGTEDRSTLPSEAKFLLDRIEHSRPLELSAAHIANVEAASAFTQGVIDFLLREVA
jgi:3-oxoadipate enol-lactonase